jgi:hypothetical protein
MSIGSKDSRIPKFSEALKKIFVEDKDKIGSEGLI